MAVPDYQSLMLPVLSEHSSGEALSAAHLVECLAVKLDLDAGDLQQRIPSGAPVFRRRIEWARFYLLRAGLLERPGRGLTLITERGRGILAERPTRIDSSLLLRFPEFAEWLAASRVKPREVDETAETRLEFTRDKTAPVLSPEEQLEGAYLELRRLTEQELLGRIRTMPPELFEDLVVQLLLRLGYGGQLGSGEAIGRSGDGGVDGVIREDPLGLDVIYIQAKRWAANVGRPEVQAFAGSLEGHRARKGVMITTSGFTADALDYVDRIEKRIVLIDGETLAATMFDVGLGVDSIRSYEVKRIDTDFFAETEAT